MMGRMSDRDAQLIDLASAQGLTAEEAERRRAFAIAARREAAAEAARQAARTPEEVALAEALDYADALLFTTERSCEEHLRQRPPELEAAAAQLRAAVEAKDPERLRFASALLTRVITGLLPPGGPGGPRAAEASLVRTED